MELEAHLTELSKVVREHREVLLTEEAAKTALVMPFLQALGYNVFNPSEVIPEFTCDVGIKKGEKVDYAICLNGSVKMLIECKPASSELNVNHASQLFRYFSTTEARVAVLTNGVVFKFFSDILNANVDASALAEGKIRNDSVGFWCEAGEYQSEGGVPSRFYSEYPTDVY